MDLAGNHAVCGGRGYSTTQSWLASRDAPIDAVRVVSGSSARPACSQAVGRLQPRRRALRSDPSVPADTPACVLQELRVENLLLIERAELELAPGLNVLTGETGAGKTVLAHALDLLLGGRARAGIVRPGASEAYVEGVFAPSPALLEQLREGEHGELLAQDAEELVLARRVGADGRTRAYLNGRTVAVADLRRIGEALLSFYGQHEHRKLTLAAAQLEILDGFCGPAQAAAPRRLRGRPSRGARSWARSWRTCASWTARASGSSTCSSTSSPRSRRSPRGRASTSGCAPSASGCAVSMRCSQPPARRRRRSPAGRATTGAPTPPGRWR